MRGLILSEASQQVGYGHLMECLAIAAAFPESQQNSITFELINSSLEAENLVQRHGLHVINGYTGSRLQGTYDWILLNTRKNTNELQVQLFHRTSRLVVIDELGGIPLQCHALINFSINQDWHDYTFGSAKPEMYLGVDFFPMREELKFLSGCLITPGSVLVSLGGADRTQTVLRVANILLAQPERSVTYVLGPGCLVSKKLLNNVVASCPQQKVVVSPDNFDELLANCEYIITAGGNTLYEAAYLRKRSLIIWEDKHEFVQGSCFQNAGVARIVGGAAKIDETLLFSELDVPVSFPQDMIDIDGNGADRIVKIICAKG